MLKLAVNDRLPAVGMPEAEIFDIIDNAHASIASRWEAGLFGKPDTLPADISVRVLAKLLEVNSNNSGVHTRDERSDYAKSRGVPWQPTRDIERSLLTQVMNLLCGNPNEFDGYVSSGGSESNVQACWIGRDALRGDDFDVQVGLIAPNTIHNSVPKAGHILSLYRDAETGQQVQYVDLDKSWGMDAQSLDGKIARLHSQGIKRAIVCISAGTTLNGICDDTPAIAEVLDRWENVQGFQTFLHVDAAFGGWVLPFQEDDSGLQRFIHLTRNPRISSISIDFHKMALCPYDAGMLIVRKPHLGATRREVSNLTVGYEYLIRGSRSGATASAIWATVNSIGIIGYKEIVNRCMQLRDVLHQELSEVPGIEVLPLGHINICPIAIDGNLPYGENVALRALFEKVFIHPGKLRRRFDEPEQEVFALHPMPHHTLEATEKFLEAIRKICR